MPFAQDMATEVVAGYHRGMSWSDEEDDQLLVLENVNVADETELQRVVDIVQGVIGAERRARVSVLTEEQWRRALEQRYTPAQRRLAVKHLRVLHDSANPQHLLVSKAAVQGINDRVPLVYAEVVYLLVAASGVPLSPLLSRGVDDILANLCSQRLGVPFFTNNAPHEQAFVAGLISCVQRQWGHEREEWALILKRDPEQFLLVVRKSQFASFWVSRAKRTRTLAPLLVDTPARQQRQVLIERLRDPHLATTDEFALFTSSCVQQFHERLDAREDA